MKKYQLPGILIISGVFSGCMPNAEEMKKPNVIYIMADDLGYGDLGCYGQEKIKTPNIDNMASEGMLFTQHYSGSTVCAPSRSSLMTGMHTGNTYIRGNKSTPPEGQYPLAAENLTVAEIMKEAGYATGAFGKWGLGMHDNEGSPNAQGFDEFFGFLCQAVAHRYYPEYIWHNNNKVYLEGNDWSHTKVYAPDVIHQNTLEFIRKNQKNPFFLYVPSIIPHAELIAPEDTFLALYRGKFDNPQTSYKGNDYGAEDFRIPGYASQNNPREVIAAMISRLDHQVGEIIHLLRELGIAENTLVIFTSDNGPHLEGGADPDFFQSAGGLKGYKRDLYEGGIRAPYIAWWPGKVKPNTTTDHISAFWDFLPTMAELVGSSMPEGVDGISFLPTLLGKKNQQKHKYLYWELHEKGGMMAIRKDDWKLVRYNVLRKDRITTELYNLKEDKEEKNNVSSLHPEITEELLKLMYEARTPSEIFPFEPQL